jgi:hypothetical protein
MASTYSLSAEMFVTWIEYLMDKRPIVWDLSEAVHLSDSIWYSIFDVGQVYNSLQPIGYITNIYQVLLGRSV